MKVSSPWPVLFYGCLCETSTDPSLQTILNLEIDVTRKQGADFDSNRYVEVSDCEIFRCNQKNIQSDVFPSHINLPLDLLFL